MTAGTVNVTQALARFVVRSQLEDIPEYVVHEGKRALLHWIGCAVGGSHERSVESALGAVTPFSGPPQASVFGRAERLDVLHAAFVNGVSTDVLSFSDRHSVSLLIGNVGPLAINPGLYSKLPYDPLKDFMPITFLVTYPNILVANSSGPSSVKDLVALARSQPGRLTYASAGTGSSTHLAAELLKSMARIDMVHVPYKGGGQAIIDVISGQVNIYFSSVLGALPHMKSGRLHALAVTSAKRSSVVKDVPTVAESGYPGFEAINWLGLLAPARTPLSVVSRVNADVIRIFREPDVEQKLVAQGGEPAAGTPDAFAAYMRSEIVKWSKVVKDAGVRPE